jgi:hypothetical protein
MPGDARSGTPPKVLLTTTVQGTVTKLRDNLSKPIQLPTTKGPVGVVDYRFVRTGDGISMATATNQMNVRYILPADDWPVQDTSELLETVADLVLATGSLDSTHRSRIPPLMQLIILAALSLPLAVLLMMRANQAKQQQTKHDVL